MSVIEIIYIIFLLGSLAFGLEAMFFGFGGKILLRLRRSRGKTFLLFFSVGLVVVFSSIVVSVLFNLEPIYFVVLVMLFTLAAGKIIGFFAKDFIGGAQAPALPEPTDEEIKKIISARGFGSLLEKSVRRRKGSKSEKS